LIRAIFSNLQVESIRIARFRHFSRLSLLYWLGLSYLSSCKCIEMECFSSV